MNHSSQHSKLTPLLAVLRVLLAVCLSISTTFSGMNLPPREIPVIAENRVWKFFPTSPETHKEKHAAIQQPQLEFPLSATKTASGVPIYVHGNPVMGTDPSGKVKGVGFRISTFPFYFSMISPLFASLLAILPLDTPSFRY